MQNAGDNGWGDECTCGGGNLFSTEPDPSVASKQADIWVKTVVDYYSQNLSIIGTEDAQCSFKYPDNMIKVRNKLLPLKVQAGETGMSETGAYCEADYTGDQTPNHFALFYARPYDGSGTYPKIPDDILTQLKTLQQKYKYPIVTMDNIMTADYLDQQTLNPWPTTITDIPIIFTNVTL